MSSPAGDRAPVVETPALARAAAALVGIYAREVGSSDVVTAFDRSLARAVATTCLDRDELAEAVYDANPHYDGEPWHVPWPAIVARYPHVREACYRIADAVIAMVLGQSPTQGTDGGVPDADDGGGDERSDGDGPTGSRQWSTARSAARCARAALVAVVGGAAGAALVLGAQALTRENAPQLTWSLIGYGQVVPDVARDGEYEIKHLWLHDVLSDAPGRDPGTISVNPFTRTTSTWSGWGQCPHDRDASQWRVTSTVLSDGGLPWRTALRMYLGCPALTPGTTQ